MREKTCSSDVEDRLVGGPVAQRVHVDLELRPPGRDERFLLGAEVVVERPHGHVGGRRDVVGRYRVESSFESEAQDGLAEGCARFRLLALAETGGFVHDHTIAERADACKFARTVHRCSHFSRRHIPAGVLPMVLRSRALHLGVDRRTETCGELLDDVHGSE